MVICLHLLVLCLSPLQDTETGQKMNIPKINYRTYILQKQLLKASFMDLSWLCVSNGIRSLSFLVPQIAKNITLLSIQVRYVMSEKVAAPLSSSWTSLNVSSVGVFVFKLPYHILLRRVGRAPYNNLTGRRCPKGYLFQFRIDYCTLFSTFDMDKLKKPMEKTHLN